MEDYFKDSIEPGEFSLALAHALRVMALLDETIWEIGDYRPFFFKESERILKNFDKWAESRGIQSEYTDTFDAENSAAGWFANDYDISYLLADVGHIELSYEKLGIDGGSEKLSKEVKQKVADLVTFENVLFHQTPSGREWLAKQKKELGKYIDLP